MNRQTRQDLTTLIEIAQDSTLSALALLHGDETSGDPEGVSMFGADGFYFEGEPGMGLRSERVEKLERELIGIAQDETRPSVQRQRATALVNTHPLFNTTFVGWLSDERLQELAEANQDSNPDIVLDINRSLNAVESGMKRLGTDQLTGAAGVHIPPLVDYTEVRQWSGYVSFKRQAVKSISLIPFADLSTDEALGKFAHEIVGDYLKNGNPTGKGPLPWVPGDE